MKLEKVFTLKNELGLHARVAALLVNVGNRYTSVISFEKDGTVADGSSILDILTLACPKGSSFIIKADGDDAGAALEEFDRLIESKFGED